MPAKINWKDHQIQNIINKYIDGGLSLQNIADKYSVCKKTISSLLEKYEIDRREVSSYRKYHVDGEYFDEINTKEKAYWLGMIVADGNVYDNTLNLGLQKSDIRHVYKFRQIFHSNHPIKKYGNSYVCQIHSKSLVKSLKKYNIIPNKCKIITMPKLSVDFESHFWRGVFDGDGTIGFRKRNQYQNWYIALVGNKFLLKQFEKFVKNICETKASVRKKNTAHSFSVNGNLLTLQLADVIYDNSNFDIRLSRKYKKYEQMKKYVNAI
jgi:hypothetical protein